MTTNASPPRNEVTQQSQAANGLAIVRMTIGATLRQSPATVYAPTRQS